MGLPTPSSLPLNLAAGLPPQPQLTPRDPKDFPLLINTSWYQKQWKLSTKSSAANGDMLGPAVGPDDVAHPDGSHVASGNPAKSGARTFKKNESQSKQHHYLQDENGNIVSDARADAMRRVAREGFTIIAEAGLAKDTWQHHSVPVRRWFRTFLSSKFIEFEYCDLEWKAEQLARDIFSAWMRSPNRAHYLSHLQISNPAKLEAKEEDGEPLPFPIPLASNPLLGLTQRKKRAAPSGEQLNGVASGSGKRPKVVLIDSTAASADPSVAPTPNQPSLQAAPAVTPTLLTSSTPCTADGVPQAAVNESMNISGTGDVAAPLPRVSIPPTLDKIAKGPTETAASKPEALHDAAPLSLPFRMTELEEGSPKIVAEPDLVHSAIPPNPPITAITQTTLTGTTPSSATHSSETSDAVRGATPVSSNWLANPL